MNADLSFADLIEAKLCGANLTHAFLNDANLIWVNLTDAISDNTICPDGTLNSGSSPCTSEQLLLTRFTLGLVARWGFLELAITRETTNPS